VLTRLTTVAQLHQTVADARQLGKRVGLVPTMGALHEGHATLIKTAAAASDVVVTTIFVNPLQFGPTEDFTAYPRGLDADARLAEVAGAAVLFCPTVDEMYPFGSDNVLTSVRVSEITDVLDGVSRPGHFEGVATVVAKLFAMTGACRAFFGEKDFQQLAVIRRMALDLSFPIEVIGVPTVRELNGLAMSSRNRYLSDEQRDGAGIIFRALCAGRALIDEGASRADQVNDLMHGMLTASSFVDSIDYAVCVDAATLRAPAPNVVVHAAMDLRLLIACRVGPARLIDNL
jgi:pantoate--beta-alanine ligase